MLYGYLVLVKEEAKVLAGLTIKDSTNQNNQKIKKIIAVSIVYLFI